MSTRINPYPNRPGQTAGPSDGSRTITIHDVPTGERGGGQGESEDDTEENSHQAGVLRLRGGGNTRRVVWTSETVDNEGIGKKKSKICCIYHKPKAFDESSDESSGSSSSDSDSPLSDTSMSSHASVQSGINASKSLRDKKQKGKRKSKECKHDHDDSHGGNSNRRQRGAGSWTMVERQTQEETKAHEPTSKPVPNAYEQGFS